MNSSKMGREDEVIACDSNSLNLLTQHMGGYDEVSRS